MDELDRLVPTGLGAGGHGAGRTMSRHQAARRVEGAALRRELEAQGVVVKG